MAEEIGREIFWKLMFQPAKASLLKEAFYRQVFVGMEAILGVDDDIEHKKAEEAQKRLCRARSSPISIIMSRRPSKLSRQGRRDSELI